MDASSRPRIAITLGDPNGIGPEVTLKCLRDPSLRVQAQPVVMGSAHVLREHARALGYGELTLHTVTPGEAVPDEGLAILDVLPEETPAVDFGRVTADGGRLAMRAVDAATEACIDGWADAMVTAPLSKDAISRAGYRFPGHTEFIAERTGADSYAMMMVAGDLRVGLVTAHVPIAEVPSRITEDAILGKLRVIQRTLRQDFGIAEPTIAVLGLNPHAGDGGVIGQEEKEVITPALKAAKQEGMHVAGPLPADGFFATDLDSGYDAVLAMYHDQGLVPFKALAFDRGVNFTAGLPIVRTSPDHGTAYNIAGQGVADAGSMRSAIELAVEVASRRTAQPTV
jgi:4-hydroxythreonine-4-phosphate dehydrogenase